MIRRKTSGDVAVPDRSKEGSRQMRGWKALSLLSMFFLTAIFIVITGISVHANVESSRDSQLPANDLLQFKSGGHIIGFKPDAVYMAGMGYVLTEEFVGANRVMPVADESGADRAEGSFTRAKGAPELKAVTYQNLWDGISLRYEAKQGGITESIYTIKPKADAGMIRLRYNGEVEVQKNGTLRFKHPTEKGYFTMSAPIAWQEIDGKRVNVEVVFNKHKDDTIGFKVGQYNRNHPLIIDPTYEWHTFHGSGEWNSGYGIAVDGSGNVYVTGESEITWGSPVNDHSDSEGSDIVVLKLNNSGALQWHTFHGSEESDYGYGIAVDGSGNVYVAGSSGDTWGNPVNGHSGMSSIVVLKLADGYTLTVTKSGTGSGTVTSSPKDINCGVDCSKSYSSGTSVTLTATPSAGSVFTGWSNGTGSASGCKGTGNCSFIITANSGVTAIFTQTGKPVISVSPKSLKFSSVKVGDTATGTLTIKNTGESDLVIYSITIEGTNPDEFKAALVNECTSPIPAGDMCTVEVTFEPSIPFGKKSAIMSIASNDSKKSTVKVKLSGIAPPPKITVFPKTLNLSSMKVGDESTGTITVVNTGLSDLIISNIVIEGINASDFSQTDDCKIMPIVQGGSCTISVTFSPSAIGKRGAVINIFSNASNKPKSVKLKGSCQCLDIAGSWAFYNSGTVKCTGGGETEIISIEGSGTVTINQSGCSVSWSAGNDDFDADRSGVISGNNIKVSGVFVIPLVDEDEITLTANKYTATGTVVGNKIDLSGSGIASGTYEDIYEDIKFSFSCKGTDKAVFTRPDSVMKGISSAETVRRQASIKPTSRFLKMFKIMSP